MLRKNTNAYFTPPTRTRQNCLVLSCPCRRCEQNWRQDKTVLSCLDPVSNLQQFSLKYIQTWIQDSLIQDQNQDQDQDFDVQDQDRDSRLTRPILEVHDWDEL